MVRDTIEDLHKERLAAMCSQLDIGVDAYFDWGSRFGYAFNSLVLEALQNHCSLSRLVRERVTYPNNGEDDIVVELLKLMA
jgi:hypothetical protein